MSKNFSGVKIPEVHKERFGKRSADLWENIRGDNYQPKS